MKKLFIPLIFLLLNLPLGAQNKPKEKPPTQKEMEEMMKEAQQMVEGLSAEDKRMMDSLGIKLPDFKKSPKTSDKTIQVAWEDENRRVPKKDLRRIASIPSSVTDARMTSYVNAIQSGLEKTLDAAHSKMAQKIAAYIQSNSLNSSEAGVMASSFWLLGKPQIALFTLGTVCRMDSKNTDNLSNYAAMLSMQGAEHLAIPILENLNRKFPQNSTLLNNLGQAWLGLGDLLKAEKYLDSAIALYPLHPQANMAKAAIAESKGKTEQARQAIKKSLQHAYSKEKESRLAALGTKLTARDYKLPTPFKKDALNLGGFKAPDFPINVEGCIKAETEWNIFYNEIDQRIEKLELQKENAMAVVQKATYTTVPMYAERATKLNQAGLELTQVKFLSYQQKVAAFTTEALALKKMYDEKMKKLRKEDSEQTGAGRANEAYCKKYKEASDNYLEAINTKMKDLYTGALQLKKEIINESANYALYSMWPEQFQAAKLEYQIEWLKTMKKGLGIPTFGSSFPFISITEFVCEEDEMEEENMKLQNFDDVACQYKSKLDLFFAEIESNCSRLRAKLDVKFLQYTRYDDFERAEGDTYISSTIKISAEMGKSANKGPLKAEAKIGAGVELEMDRQGVKDVSVIAEAKVGAGTNVIDKQLEEGGSIAGKDVVDTTVEAGVEGRISLISGQSSVSGTGILNGLQITSF
jgi:Tfp pilus assembly protein PilF